MSNHALWRVVLVLWALAPATAALIWPHRAPAATVNSPTIRNLRFSELEALALAESPRLHIVEQRLAAARAERDDALQWSNPALAFEHEDVESSREWQITLGKRLAAPFAQGSQREAWEARVSSAEYRKVQETAELVAGLKAGYVRLRLLDDYLDRLARLAELMEAAAADAGHRHAAGNLSGAETQLARLASLGIDAGRRRIEQHRRELAAVWRADMGIPRGVQLQLATAFPYEQVILEEVSEYIRLLDDRPARKAQEALVRSQEEQVDATRPSLLPGIDVHGGYKRTEPGSGGFVAGLTFDLPLFAWKAGNARLHEARLRTAESDLAIHRSRTAQEVESLVLLLEEVQQSLAAFAELLARDPSLIDTLYISYREGSLSLDAFLNAIQVESAALENHYQELSGYYLNIFRLEAITGVSIIQPES